MRVVVVLPRSNTYCQHRPNSIETVVRTLLAESRYQRDVTVVCDAGAVAPSGGQVITVPAGLSRRQRTAAVADLLRWLKPDVIEHHQQLGRAADLARRFSHRWSTSSTGTPSCNRPRGWSRGYAIAAAWPPSIASWRSARARPPMSAPTIRPSPDRVKCDLQPDRDPRLARRAGRQGPADPVFRPGHAGEGVRPGLRAAMSPGIGRGAALARGADAGRLAHAPGLGETPSAPSGPVRRPGQGWLQRAPGRGSGGHPTGGHRPDALAGSGGAQPVPPWKLTRRARR